MTFVSIPVETLRKLLSYDPETGKLTWLERAENPNETVASIRRWNACYAGTIGFTTVNISGYYYGAVYNQKCLAHRVAWAIYYGEWPKAQLDHINRNRKDNRIVNLRPATPGENNKNRNRQTNNKSGVTGVSWCAKARAWRAQIQVNGKNKCLGTFTSKPEAVAIRRAAEKTHNFHPTHGRQI